jgi:antitoxin (DNA-binding transcriptional repressor) of toxin-antitoxin stability system
MNPITIAEAVQKLPELIDAALRGEEVIITRGDRSVVKLIPATSAKSRKPGSAKDMVWVSDDFDEPLEEFKEYME